ncbi:MAG: tripartite tricarboxylate transporter TctB family protein [Fibrobacteria bacterium]|nr:tripartite tricarboxylate transporter TctB family protein [Fibrobacteria bacterium]
MNDEKVDCSSEQADITPEQLFAEPEVDPVAEKRSKRIKDIFFALIYVGLSLLILTEGKSILVEPSLARLPKVSNPGSTIFFMGCLMLTLGAILGIIAAFQAGNPFKYFVGAKDSSFWTFFISKQFLFLFVLGLYIFALWEIIPYWASTFLFLVVGMLIFGSRSWLKIALTGVIGTAVMTFLFGTVAQVLLP